MRGKLLHYAPKLLQSFWPSFFIFGERIMYKLCVTFFVLVKPLKFSQLFISVTFWNLHEPALECRTLLSSLPCSSLCCFHGVLFLEHILSVPSAKSTSHSNPNRSQVDLMLLDVRVHIHSSHTPKEVKETLPGPVFVHWNKKANIDSVWTMSHSDEGICDILLIC